MNSRAWGFTLVELALVLLIMGVLLTIVAPRLPDITATRTEASASRLSILLSYLHDEASLRGETYRVVFDLETDRYDVDVRGEPIDDKEADAFAERWDPYARSAALPDGVSLISLASATGVQTSGSFELLFLPEGNQEDITIVVGGSEGDSFSVAYRAITGRVEVRPVEPGV